MVKYNYYTGLYLPHIIQRIQQCSKRRFLKIKMPQLETRQSMRHQNSQKRKLKKSQLTYEKVFDLSHIQEHNFKTMRCQFCLWYWQRFGWLIMFRAGQDVENQHFEMLREHLWTALTAWESKMARPIKNSNAYTLWGSDLALGNWS